MWDISRIGQYGILLLGISSEASRRRGMEKVNSFREPVGAAGFCAIWQRNGEAGIRKKQHNCKLAFPEGEKMNGVIDYNWLGIAFISDDLPQKVHKAIEKKMDELEAQVNAEFDQWLDENGLERVMGVVIKKQVD